MQINITCGVGSTGRIAAMLYDECIAQGYETCFAYSTFKPVLRGAFSIETRIQNYMRRGLDRYFGRKQKHASPGTKRLIRYIRKQKPDLIHLHNIQQNCVNYIILLEFLKEKQIPVVYTLHDCWSFTGGCYHFAERQCDGYKRGCHDCPIPYATDDITIGMELSYSIKQSLIGGNPNMHIVCVSDWLKSCALQSYLGNMKDVRTIYNGVDTSVFRPTPSDIRKRLGIADDQFVILGVANIWDTRKGLETFMKLGDKLSDTCRIILVGLSDAQIADMGDRVCGVKRTENLKQLAELYSCADVFINASKEETFGLTTAEALACGTPAIVYHSTACPEIVDEKTGYVIDGDDFDEIIRAVANIHDKGKDSYSPYCVNRVKTVFEKSIMLRSYMNLYRSILDEPHERLCFE